MHTEARLDLQPTLIGAGITLRPLRADDFEALFEAAADPAIWAQHPDSKRYRREVFRNNFFTGAVAGESAFVVVDNDSGRVIGSTRFYDWQPSLREIAIGYTFIERRFWGSSVNRDMKLLLLGHAFSQAQAVWFHIGEHNLRSRRAVEKLGAVLDRKEIAHLNGGRFVKLYYRLERSMLPRPSTAPA